MTSRTPPDEVRRALRREVGFGCPVCGSPYLSYHHFDPPWRQEQHHRPEGMIALCSQHHGEADQGAFTLGQLRELKSNPMLLRTAAGPSGSFNWRRESLVFDVGSNAFVFVAGILQIRNMPVIWATYDERGQGMLNLDVRDHNGRQVIAMVDNDWTVSPEIVDLESAPHAHRLRVSSGTTWLEVSFRETSRDEYEMGERLPEAIPRTFVLCTVTGNLEYPIPVKLDGTTTTLPGHNIIGHALIVGATVALVVHDMGFYLGVYAPPRQQGPG